MDGMDDEMTTINVDTGVQEILLAASAHDVQMLRDLVRSHENDNDMGNPMNVKDPETGYTPLHAAIAACEYEGEDLEEKETANGQGANGTANGTSRDDSGRAERRQELKDKFIESAVHTVKFLLREGAIWNDLDSNDETPGCIARRIDAKELYDLMVDAGVRAELLLNRLEGYEPLVDEDEDEDENEEEANTNNSIESQHAQSQEQSQSQPPQTQNDHYLSSDLTFQPDRILDQGRNGVMMDWESDIMTRTAHKLLPTRGLRVLNIGHGMGIIDAALQSLGPSSHHIVEAHPAVIDEMKRTGWLDDKPGVHVHQGRWQDVLPSLAAEGVMFDAIYYDTFAESYADFRTFFTEMVICLLEATGRWSFFNGMGADRQISYDVYQKVVEMDLFESGFDVEWEDIPVPKLETEWQGVRRPYWTVDNYRLPLCTYMD